MHRASGSPYACLHGEHGHCDESDDYEDDLHPFDSDGAVACDVCIQPLGAFEEAGLVVASCHFSWAVQIGIHFTAHHGSFGGAAPSVASALGVVEDERDESHNGTNYCCDDNAQDPEATSVLGEVKRTSFVPWNQGHVLC